MVSNEEAKKLIDAIKKMDEFIGSAMLFGGRISTADGAELKEIVGKIMFSQFCALELVVELSESLTLEDAI